MQQHPNVQAIQDALDAAGAVNAAGEPCQVLVLTEPVHTAAAAAAAIGIEVGQIANSLIFDADGEPLLVLTSGAHRVDTAKVAALIGAPRLDRADADFVRDRTGFAIGGVAPVGHTTVLQTLVDDALAAHEQVWAAAGHPRTVFPTTFSELIRITGGLPATVA